MDDDYELISSPLEREVVRDGVTVRICIYRGEPENEWTLEIEDHTGGSTVWDDRFPTDQAALDEAMNTIEAEGIASFAAAHTK